MALRDRANQAQLKGISLYSPARQIVGERPAPRAPRQAPQETGDPVFDRMRAKIAAKQAKQEEDEDKGNAFGRGLGFIVNNPVTQTALKPLEVLDVPRRAVWSTINEVADAFNGGDASLSDWYDQINPLNAIHGEGDTTFGAGDVIGDTGNKWVDRAVGLVGDIALDPLTYATFGVAPASTKGAQLLGRSARLTRLADAAHELERAGKLTDEAIAGLRRTAERGLGSAPDEILDAAKLGRSGVRMEIPFTDIRSGVIPGTGKAADAIDKVLGGAKQRLNTGDRAARLYERSLSRGGMESVERTLTHGKSSNDEFLAALRAIKMNNTKRAASGTFRALAAAELGQRMPKIRAELDNTFGGDVNAYIRATENAKAADTEINKLSKRMVEIAKEQGVDLPEIQDMGYMPHILSAEFKQLLSGESDRAKQFKNQTGVRSEDLLRDSGFLSVRALKPKPGTTLDITIDGKTVSLTEGSIAEINEKVAELFPELKGTAMETDPRALFERYVEGVADDVGLRVARKEAADSGSRWVKEIDDITGEQRPIAHGEDAFEGDELFRGVKDDAMSEEVNAFLGNQQQQLADDLTLVGDAERTPVVREATELMDEQRAALGAEKHNLEVEVGHMPKDGKPGSVGRLQRKLNEISNSLKSQGQIRRAHVAETRKTIDSMNAQVGAITKKINAIKRQIPNTIKAEQVENIRGLNAELNALRDEAEQLNALMATIDADAVRALKAEREAFLSDLNKAQAEYDDAIKGLSASGDARTIPTPKQRQDIEKASQKRQVAEAEVKELNELNARIRTVEQRRAGLPEKLKVMRQEQGDNFNLRLSQRGIAAERKMLDSQLKQFRAQRRRLANAPKRLAKAEEELQKVRLLAAEGPTRRQAAIGRVEQARTDLQGAERIANRTPASPNLVPPNGLSQEQWDQLFPPTNPGTPDRIIPDIRPANEPQSRTGYKVVRGREARGNRPHEVSKREYFNRAIQNEGRVPPSTGRRQRELPVEIQKTESEIMNELAGVGEAGQQIAKNVERQAQEEIRPLMGERFTKQRQTVIKRQERQAKLDEIDAQTTNLHNDYKQLMDDEKALKQRRYEVDRARRATDKSASPKSALGKLRGEDIQIDDKFVRPTRKNLAAHLEDDTVRVVQPLEKNLDEIEQMVRLNPDMTDTELRRVEALLHNHRESLQRATETDLSAEQAKQLVDKASNGQLIDVFVAQLRDQWNLMPEGNIVVNQTLHNMMQNVIKMKGEPTLFGSAMTAYTNFFKTYATLSPGFHVRNAISATFMNGADGVSLGNMKKGVNWWTKFIKADDPLKFYERLPPKVREAFDATFATGAGGRFFESGVAEATAIGRTQLKEGLFRNRATLWSQRKGQRVEGSVRLGMALDSIEQGQSVADAIQRISRIHFDYSQVSRLDETAKKLIPFWTFMSRNLPMQITQMWMRPRLYAQYNSVVRNISSDPAEFTPEYILQGGGFDTGIDTPKLPGMAAGMPVMLQPDLAHTRIQDDFARIENVLSGENPAQMLSDFNPALTAPIEYITGQNLFTGREYGDDDWRKMSGPVDMALAPFLAALGQVKRGEDGLYVQEKGFDAARSLIPLLDRTARLAPGAVGGTGGDRQAESVARFLGAPVRTISDDQMLSEARRRYYDSLDEQRLQQVLAGG